MKILETIKKLIRRVKGGVSSTEELLEIIKKAHAERRVPSYFYALSEQLIKIKDKTVEEVMVPRVDMVTVRADTPAREVIEVFKKYGYSKIPVVGRRVDDVVGILYIKELIKHLDRIESLKAKDLALKPSYIPDSKKVLDALREFQRKRISIGIIVDEFGSVLGLVTLEDLLEEIVGEIWEEFDVEELMYEKLDDGSYLFNARIELEQASSLLGRNLQAEDVHTLGGYILAHLDHLPQRGEKFKLDDLEFEVVDATQQRLRKVKVKPIKVEE